MQNPEPTENDNQAVLAYRVGKLEDAVAEGFKEIKAEFADFRLMYATKAEVAEQMATAKEEHVRLANSIARVDGDVRSLSKCVSTIQNGNISLSLVQKIVFTAVGIALLAIANGLMSKIIT